MYADFNYWEGRRVLLESANELKDRRSTLQPHEILCIAFAVQEAARLFDLWRESQTESQQNKETNPCLPPDKN